MIAKNTPSYVLPSRSSRVLLFGGVAVLVAIVIAVALLSLYQLRDAAENRAYTSTHSLAKSIALTIDGQISTIDVALLAASIEISQQLANGKPNETSITQMLDQQIVLLRHASILRATNEKGDVNYGSGDISVRPNNSDRDYFIRLRDDPKAGLVIGKPVIGRSNQKWSWVFARRINQPDGSFGGVIFASIPIESIEMMFKEIKAESGYMISLRDANLGLVARYSNGKFFFPGDDKGVSISLANALKESVLEGKYSVESSRFDGISRIYSYSGNAQYGFLANVGINYETAFAEWRKQAWAVSGLVLAFALALLAFSLQISRAWRARIIAMRYLAENQKMFRAFAEMSADWFWEQDSSLRFTHLSTGFIKTNDITPQLFIGKTRWEVAIDVPEEKIAAHKLALMTHQKFHDFEYSFLDGEGEKNTISVSGEPIYGAYGQFQGYRGTGKDITERKQIEEALRESEDQFRTIAASAQDAIIMMDAEGAISFWNPAAESIFKYGQEEALGKNLHHLLAPERYHAAFEAGFSRFRFTGEGGAVGRMLELAALRKDGIEIPIELSLSAVRRKDQWIAISIVRDISERKKTEAALQDSHEALQSILETTPDGFWRVDLQGNLLEVNPAYCQMSGYKREELLGMRISDVEAMESAYDTEERIRHISKYGYAQFETKHRRKDGTIWNVEASITYRNVAGGQMLAFLRDITERKQLQMELHQKATTDDLTGLINRRYFMELARKEHRRAIRLQHSLAIALIDLDHLKQINDTYGHAAGDLVLQALTNAIQKNIREIDVFARLGGDEFVLLLPGARSEQAYEVIERARRSLAAQAIDLFGKPVSITISAGIASVSSDEDTFDVLMNRADQCLYQSKASGRNRVTVDHDVM